MKASGILLCAGKGTRMNDDSKNKVCFDCAGKPVIKRIIENMKLGGVENFVVVVGHNAESVMASLDGIDGIVYAYQKEQKGTGHAALCGLRALKSIGGNGPVIVSMGDKIISPNVISGLIERSENSKAVFGVQPLSANRNGGRIALFEGSPYGIVELSDVALMKLAGLEENEYVNTLENIGLNPKKIEKVVAAAKENTPKETITLNGHAFYADELLNSKYANAALYCFDIEKATEIIEGLGANNAQGEIYITDAMECFAKDNNVELYVIENKSDMLTYSTKPELCKIGEHFMRNASSFVKAIADGEFDDLFKSLYSEDCEAQKERYVKLLELSIREYGDKKVVITRSPGRINLMGRHIDHRGGNINVMATNKDTVAVVSLRDDDTVNMVNLESSYPKCDFSISKELNLAEHTEWLEYIEDDRVVQRLKESRGLWSNYIKAAVLRAQIEVNTKIRGMDFAFSGIIPVAAGLSSSSSFVVATMEAVQALHCLNFSDKKFVDLCGEGEWFVGSRGGAGDHAAMKFGKTGKIVQLGFKPFTVGESVPFSNKYAVVVANSGIKARKSEGSKDKFNAKVAAYEFSFMLLKKKYPEYGFIEFRDIARVRPYSIIYNMLRNIPEFVTRDDVVGLLPEYSNRVQSIFKTHEDPGVYELRGVALYGVSECLRAEKCMDLLRRGDYIELGEMMKTSHNGDRIFETDISDAKLEELEKNNTDAATVYGAYGCSTVQIDYLCDLFNTTDGVLGSELVGAGLGGCVIALIEKEKAQKIISVINSEYYDKYGIEYGANVFFASAGSSIFF